MLRRADVPRDLLFGLLALQNGMIHQAQLVAAFQAWTLAAGRPLAEVLVEQGALAESRRALLEALVTEHLAMHGGAPERSLATLVTDPSTRAVLANLGDAAIEASLAHVGSRSTEDAEPDRTGTYPVGGTTSDGPRFRVLRPHARGGLGAVFVALDEELHREVALKQILDQHADDPTCRARFLREAEITGRLEHPGIVPVYGLGTDPDGRPYYAMRLIRGDSLKIAIAAFHTDVGLKRDPGRRSLEFRKLLRRFLDVCNAIAYAHRRGVLHRDLKPSNVMLGEYGETIVVDWGLTKSVGRLGDGPEAEGPLLVPSSSGDVVETLPGSALGTPGYMSPEQSTGALDRVGAASDVYSLGATLYCIMTGRSPFQGDDLGAVIGAVQKGEFPAPRKLDPAIDRALEAVCLKAMALRPEDRYASPRALADDVERWMADEPVTAWKEPTAVRARRWLARHRNLVTAGVAGILAVSIGLTSFGFLEAEARGRIEDSYIKEKQSKAVAQGRLNLALEAVRAYHTEVTEDVLLKTPALKGLRTKLLRWPLEFYKRVGELPTLDSQDPSNRAMLAEMYTRLAHVTRDVGTKAQAIEGFRRANALLEAISRDDPSAIKPRADAAYNHNQIALLLSDLGRYPEALASFQLALGIRETISRANPQDVEMQVSVANVHNNIGNLLESMGKTDEALASHRRALALRESLSRDAPDSLMIRHALAMSHLNLGNLMRGAERLHSYQKSVELCTALVRDAPGTDEYRLMLTTGHENVGDAQREIGDLAEARRALGEALGLLEPMVQAYPTKVQYRESLARIFFRFARVRSEAGELTEAIAMYRKAAEHYRGLGDDDPENSGATLDAAGCYSRIGGICLKLGLRDDAERAYVQARDLYQVLAAADPQDPKPRARLADVSTRLKAIQGASSRPPEAGK
jgi:serine/threonine-protein kinase